MLALVHPFPSALNALLVVGLGVAAGGGELRAAVLGLGMLGVQFAIGAANDSFDVELDAATKPSKPIPAGLVSRPTAASLAAGCAGGGLLAAMAVGPVPLLLAALILAAGVAYDAFLKRAGVGWLAFVFAFPLLPVYAWYGAVGELPPRPELLLPVAALAGPTLQLANGLVDLERDARLGVIGLAGRLGRRRAWLTMAFLELAIFALAWATTAGQPSAPDGPRLIVGAATVMAAIGVGLSTGSRFDWREWGWRLQAAAIALLAIGWVLLSG